MSVQPFTAIKEGRPLQGEAVGRIFILKEFLGKLYKGIIDAHYDVVGEGPM